MIRRAIILVLPALISAQNLSAQNHESRSKASDYPAHVKIANLEIGAECLVHSVPAASGSYFTKDYLVIDVGIFPPADGFFVSSSQFTLRVNGKPVLFSQSPGMVAASFKYPDWEQRPGVTAEAGNGNGGLIYGQPRVGRFPGDPTNSGSSIPPRPKTGEDENVGRPPGISIEEGVKRAALPEGRAERPVKGCLFFPFTGKTKSIKSLELLFESDSGAGAKLVL